MDTINRETYWENALLCRSKENVSWDMAELLLMSGNDGKVRDFGLPRAGAKSFLLFVGMLGSLRLGGTPCLFKRLLINIIC